jgi:hypothetical protein
LATFVGSYSSVTRQYIGAAALQPVVMPAATIADSGQIGPDCGGGGKYLIVPPGSDVRQMRGYIVARSPSNQVWFAARALDRDPGAAEAIARQHKVYGWGQRDNPPATTCNPVDGRDWASAHPGRPFNPTDRQEKILTEAAQVGEFMARANAYDKRLAGSIVWPGKRWEHANMVELYGPKEAYFDKSWQLNDIERVD